jgi:hypothetical protein
METYGQDVQDVGNATAMGGYVAMASLLTSLGEISGEITPETIVEAAASSSEVRRTSCDPTASGSSAPTSATPSPRPARPAG